MNQNLQFLVTTEPKRDFTPSRRRGVGVKGLPEDPKSTDLGKVPIVAGGSWQSVDAGINRGRRVTGGATATRRGKRAARLLRGGSRPAAQANPNDSSQRQLNGAAAHLQPSISVVALRRRLSSLASRRGAPQTGPIVHGSGRCVVGGVRTHYEAAAVAWSLVLL